MKNCDHSMRILTGIAIILVVLGHLDCQVLAFGGLFPYYSYHVMIFMFVSGYFYKPENEERILKYAGRKALHLLVPYYIWNAVYGVISTILAGRGFAFCSRMSLYNFLIEPFLGGHQYGLNFAAWFVPALFAVEMLNILGRRFLSLIHIKYEWLIMAASGAAGMATVYLASTGHVWGLYKTPGRILFMLPVYEFGYLYHTCLESREKKIPVPARFAVILAVQAGVYFFTGGSMNFSAVWCTGFASLPFIPYVTTLTGTFLWLNVSRLAAGHIPGRILEKAGEDSFDIMMHHVTVFFLINLAAFCIAGDSPQFDGEAFMTNVNYTFLPGGAAAWKLAYAFCGIAVPIAVRAAVSAVRRRLSASA